MGMKSLSTMKIKSINGARLKYIDRAKKPLLSLKILWKDNKVTWESSKNISFSSLVKYEDYIWKKATQNTSHSFKEYASDYKLTSYMIDNTLRNSLHYFPLNKSFFIINLFSKKRAFSNFKDYTNRTPLELLINYNEINGIKELSSNLSLTNSNLTNIGQISQLLSSKVSTLNTNNRESEISLLKTLKLLILFYFQIEIFPALNYLNVGDIYLKEIVKDSNSKMFKNVSIDNINSFMLLNLSNSIVASASKTQISKRKINDKIEILEKDNFNKKSYWGKRLNNSNTLSKNSKYLQIIKSLKSKNTKLK